MLVDVVVVSYNSRATLRDCVQPLAELDWARVTVVDNASADRSTEVVEDLRVEVIRSPHNGGFSYGCNLGAATGKAPYVLFLNPDARLDPDALDVLVRALEQDHSLGVVGPRILNDDGTLAWSQRRFPRLRSTYAQALGLHRVAAFSSWAGEVIQDPAAYARPGMPDWLSGSCMLMRRSALAEVGGLDEGFFLYSEETDLFRRLRHRGWGVRFEPNATAYHQGYGSAPWATVTPVLAGSRVRYARKHHGRLVAALEAIGVAIDSLVRAAARVHRPTRRRAHLAAARAALSSLRPPSRRD